MYSELRPDQDYSCRTLSAFARTDPRFPAGHSPLQITVLNCVSARTKREHHSFPLSLTARLSLSGWTATLSSEQSTGPRAGSSVVHFIATFIESSYRVSGQMSCPCGQTTAFAVGFMALSLRLSGVAQSTRGPVHLQNLPCDGCSGSSSVARFTGSGPLMDELPPGCASLRPGLSSRRPLRGLEPSAFPWEADSRWFTSGLMGDPRSTLTPDPHGPTSNAAAPLPNPGGNSVLLVLFRGQHRSNGRPKAQRAYPGRPGWHRRDTGANTSETPVPHLTGSVLRDMAS